MPHPDNLPACLVLLPGSDYDLIMEQSRQHDGGSDIWLVVSAGRGPACGPLSKRQAFGCALVLDARSIPCQVVNSDGIWQVRVPPEHIDLANQQLKRYEEENRGWPPPPPPDRPRISAGFSTLSVLVLLATFHNLTGLPVTGPGALPIDWGELGSARAAYILDGQWWRLVTSLTLHADLSHLLGNLAFGGVFVLLLCQEICPGPAWTLILTSGAIGNLLNALFQSPAHRSVGASTAVFGAVGILGAISMVRYRHHLERRWPVPVAAALALLAILGTEGKNTDLGAHLFGFLAGAALGVATETLIIRQGFPGRRLNILTALLSGLVILYAWFRALTAEI